MSGDVVYSDVKFAKKGGKKEPSSNQEDVTYSEVRKPTPNNAKVHPPQDEDVTYSMVTIGLSQRNARGNSSEKQEDATYAEVQRGPQLNKSSGNSKVKKRVAVGILIAVLVLAIIGIAVFYTMFMRGGTTEPQITPNITVTTSPTSTTRSTSPTSPTTTTTATTCPVTLSCGTGWHRLGKKCYYFSTSAQTWSFSRRTCQDLSGDLVKIESRQEQRVVFDYLVTKMENHADKFWIGLTDAKIEGLWKWADGSPLNTRLTFWFNHQGQKEPDNWTGENPEGEDCVRMGEKADGFIEKCWFDQNCNAEQKFICEKEPLRSPNCQT